MIKLIINKEEKKFDSWIELKTFFNSYNQQIDRYNVEVDGKRLSTLSSMVFTTTGRLPEIKENKKKRRRFF